MSVNTAVTFVDMTNREREATASDVVAERVAASRRKRGWTARQLAERCAELGATQITAATLANIESGRRDKDGRRRRDVSVDELLALALALDVAPVHLLVPERVEPYQVTPTVENDTVLVRNWVRGFVPLPGTDWAWFITERPAHELPVRSSELPEDEIQRRRHWYKLIAGAILPVGEAMVHGDADDHRRAAEQLRGGEDNGR